MLITPTIAAVDGEAIVWVVIIFGGVIGQIFKAIRKASKNKTPPPTVKPVAPPSAPESTYRAPKQEIRQFLESLGTKMDVTPAPPPRAVPVPNLLNFLG